MIVNSGYSNLSRSEEHKKHPAFIYIYIYMNNVSKNQSDRSYLISFTYPAEIQIGVLG